MRATLEFNLDDADDRKAHMRCVKSEDMAIAFWDLLYKEELLTHDVIREKLEERNILLDELIV